MLSTKSKIFKFSAMHAGVTDLGIVAKFLCMRNWISTCSFTELGCNCLDPGLLQEGRVFRLGPGPVRRAKGTVYSHHDVFGRTVLAQLLLS